MRELAKYTDQGINLLKKAVRTGAVGMQENKPDENILTTINESLEQQMLDTQKVSEDLDEIDGLYDLVNNTRSAVEELKKYAHICDINIVSTQYDENKFAYSNGSMASRKPTPSASPIVNRNDFNSSLPKASYGGASSTSGFREIDQIEYNTVPPITKLLIKIEDVNKYYNLLFSLDHTKITQDEMNELVALSSSRRDAFIRTLVSLNRMNIIEKGTTVEYQLL